MFCRNGSRGSALLEFAFTGTLLIFIWTSIAEGSLGVWNYFTLQYAAKTAGSYAAVHGATCAISPNACTVTVSNIASVFQTAAMGIPPNLVVLTFTTASGAATTCNLGGSSNLCSSVSTTWPPASNSDNAVGKNFEINAMYTFRSTLAMGPITFGTIYFPGDTQQIIQY